MANMSWDIHGHEWAADLLEKHIANGKLRHAYMFSGPGGVGRRTLALRLAQAVNCPQPPTPGQPCGTCKTCTQIERMQYPDLTIVQSEEDSSVLKVDQVRALQHFLSLAPFEGNYRVALLRNFEEANASAQNALLKTLEEPNPKVLLVVTVDDAENLLPTITSRCELLRLRPMAVDDLRAVLSAGGAEESSANLIAHVSGGRPGYARRLVENPELLRSREEQLEELTGLLGDSIVGRFQFSALLTRGKNRRKPRAKAKEELLPRMELWLSFWRDVLLLRSGGQTKLTNIDQEPAINAAAQAVEMRVITRVLGQIEHGFIRAQSANLQLLVDNILMDWPTVKV